MKIAIVDHVSAGGVSRFVANLIDGFVESEDVESVTYFVSSFNITRDNLDGRWARERKLELVPIAGALDEDWRWQASGAARLGSVGHRLLSGLPAAHAAARALYRVGRRLLGHVPPASAWYYYALDDEVVSRFAEFDVVYIAWPFFLEPFECDAPIVATFHDFNFEHFPGSFTEDQLVLARRQTNDWLARVDTAVTSTHFIGSEIDKFFPKAKVEKRVVYLAPYTKADPLAREDAELIASTGATHPYVIYSGGTAAHKNILGIFTALATLDYANRPLLVITGIGTERIGSPVSPEDSLAPVNKIIADTGLRLGTDYLPLGYVPEHQVDELTRAADLVISASKYEAGCGPALDAWQLGAPVAFSGIPSFVEQTRRFSVEAVVFDPDDHLQIADALELPFTDPGALRAMAARSQAAMLRYDWREVATGYLEVLREAAGYEDRAPHGTDEAAPHQRELK